MMRALVLILIAVAAASAHAAETSARDRWLARQIERSESSNTSEAAVLAVIWKHEQCEYDKACEAGVDSSGFAVRARKLAHKQPHLLALLANTGHADGRDEDLLLRWREIANADPQNVYPLAHVAGFQWQLGQTAAALETLSSALERPDVDDYYTAMYLTVKRALDPDPPALDEIESCWNAGETSDTAPTAAAREISTINSLLGDVGFGSLSDLFALCKAGNAPLGEERRALCSAFGKRLSMKASTLLIRNIGLVFRRSATTDTEEQALFTQAQHDNSDAVERGVWWLEPDSSVRELAYRVWFEAFATGGEIAGARALLAKYGDPPRTREEREARSQKRITEGQACYAKRREAASRDTIPTQPSP